MATCNCAKYRIPDQLDALVAYIKTLDDGKILAITSANNAGQTFVIVTSKA